MDNKHMRNAIDDRKFFFEEANNLQELLSSERVECALKIMALSNH